MSSIKIKVSLGDDMRRITVDRGSNFASFVTEISTRFGIDAAVSLHWVDEDSDQISIKDDADLQEAFLSMQTGVLRVLASSAKTPAKATEDACTEDTEGRLRNLAHSLGLEEISDKLLKGLARKLEWAAPLAKQFLAENSSSLHDVSSACDLFKLLKGAQCKQRCSKSDKTAAVHHGVSCDVSGMNPIVGIRYKKRGENYDLCAAEYDKLSSSDKEAFERIETPRSFTFYAGCHPFGHMFQACKSAATKPVLEGDILPEPPISPGSVGAGVKQLQHALISLDLLQPSAIRFCAGRYGPRTAAAISKIQESVGAHPTGTFDAAVHDHLLARLHAQASEPEQKKSEQPVQQCSFASSPFAAFMSPLFKQMCRSRLAAEGAAPCNFFQKMNQAAAHELDDSSESVAAPADFFTGDAAAKLAEAMSKLVTSNSPPHDIPEAPHGDHIADGNVSLLMSMGFGFEEATEALTATKGSLERAADKLLEAKADKVELHDAPDEEFVEVSGAAAEEKVEFPEEWVELLANLQEMGFEEKQAHAALVDSNGEFKEAVKQLVKGERDARRA